MIMAMVACVVKSRAGKSSRVPFLRLSADETVRLKGWATSSWQNGRGRPLHAATEAARGLGAIMLFHPAIEACLH